jgi:hypothetical protein
MPPPARDAGVRVAGAPARISAAFARARYLHTPLVGMCTRKLFLTAILATIGCGPSLGPETDAMGGLPACTVSSTNPGLLARDDADRRPQMSLAVPVTVVSVTECPPGICSGTDIAVSEAGGRRWWLSADFPGLPADIVSVGEVLELRFEYRPIASPFGVGGMFEYWTTVLSRNGTPVLFDACAASDLAPYGITAVSGAGGRCQSLCVLNGANVTYGTETRNVAPNQTASIGKLTFTHRHFVDTEICFGDVPMPLGSMAGFVTR